MFSRGGSWPVSLFCNSPRPATGASRALRARSVPGVSPKVSPNTGGVQGSVRQGVSRVLRAPAPECPKSVPRVSPECPGHLFLHSGDTLGTLFGHSFEHPVGHSLGHPPFSGTLLGMLRGGVTIIDVFWDLWSVKAITPQKAQDTRNRGRHLQECSGARPGKCPTVCFFECFWAPGFECHFLSVFWDFWG